LVEAFNRLDASELVLDIHDAVPALHEEEGYKDLVLTLAKRHLDVRFHGRYEWRELARILAHLDVLVVPSLCWESFCLIAREGALAGLRVVGSTLGELGEAVEEGLCLGFEAGNPEDLADKLRLLIGDEALRDEMSRKAGLVRSIESCVDETEEIYRDVMPRQGV
ncbi:MAG: glycosyltransferase, partial [Planctomycetota bacterium]